MKRIAAILLCVCLAIPAAAYVVVPVEDSTTMPTLSWVCEGLPPDVQIATGIAPMYLFELTWVEVNGMLECGATLVVRSAGPVGPIHFQVIPEMLPILERMEREGAAMVAGR